MPKKQRSLCQCRGIITNGVCDRCGTKKKKRKSRHARGYDNAWDRLSRKTRRLIPCCIPCWGENRFTLATSVHHVLKIKDRPDLRMEPDNLLGVCEDCHTPLDELYEGNRKAYDERIIFLRQVRGTLEVDENFED